jgi:class 3 adenylate cyclase
MADRRRPVDRLLRTNHRRIVVAAGGGGDTVVAGPAVNLVSRIEAIAKSRDLPLM